MPWEGSDKFSFFRNVEELTNNQMLLFLEYLIVLKHSTKKGQPMCDNCDNKIEEGGERELALYTLALLGGMIDTYVEEGYADPTMYKALTIAETIAKKLEAQDLADRLVLLKIQAGEIIEDLIEKNEMEIKREDWS